MILAVTIDVEEEGLFSNMYDPTDVPTENVSRLSLLDPVFVKHGIRPTLLVTYPVARNPAHRKLLLDLRDRWNGEIGSHLHPWNTPPFEKSPLPEPVPSEHISRRILSAKLETLHDTLRTMGVEPVSFRMGRFNLGPQMLSVLETAGIQVDSSVAPMRRYYGGPDHLHAPADPYFPDPTNPCARGSSPILEAPMTIVPIVRGLGWVTEKLIAMAPAVDAWASRAARDVGSLPVQPMWTGLRRLMTAVYLHRIRGGHFITLFFHSSELMPGGNPDHASEADVARFIDRLDRFFGRLRSSVGVESVTLSELRGFFNREEE